MNKTWVGAASANYAKGRSGYKVGYIVLHWIVGHLNAADATFQDPKRIASAHYGIEGNEVHQYVQEGDVAYHAGAGEWNWKSVGIEHAGGPDLPITEATIQTSALLVADLCRRYGIPCDRAHIRKHNELKATACPGTLPVDRIVGLAKQHLSGSTGEGEEMTNEDAVKYELRDIADVIGGDPHYEENQPAPFKAHMNRVLGGPVNEMRYVIRDFLRDYGWKTAADVKTLQEQKTATDVALADANRQLALKQDEIAKLTTALNEAKQGEKMPDFGMAPDKLDNLGDYFKKVAKLIRKGVK